MLNKIVIMGRLTRDPELRRTTKGTAVATFTIACDRDFKSSGGEKETDFIDIVAWRSTAEYICKFFSKGRMAIVEGTLQIQDWVDRDGTKRRTPKIVAANVYFGDYKSSESKNNWTPPSTSGEVSGDFTSAEQEEGELPF